MKRIVCEWVSPAQRIEIHHDEVKGEYILMCGLGNIAEFTTPTIYTKVLVTQSDAQTLGNEFLISYGAPKWAK